MTAQYCHHLENYNKFPKPLSADGPVWSLRKNVSCDGVWNKDNKCVLPLPNAVVTKSSWCSFVEGKNSDVWTQSRQIYNSGEN